jgi:hypothetical protein
MPNVKAIMTQELDSPPTSGRYEEIIFDLGEPWRGQNWHYVLFTTATGDEWCGHFREKESHNFLTTELPDKNIACVVSGGHGYIIDIGKKEKIKDLSSDMIISLASDNSTSFIVATYRNISRVDSYFNETEIALPIQADGIYFLDTKDNKLSLDIEEIGADMKRNKDFYIDLNDWTVKKHWA